jgi:hypothetical protein
MLNLDRPRGSLLPIAALSAMTTLDAVPALATPEEIIVAGTIPLAQRDAELNAARAFYDFWSAGDVAFLKHALADDFTDRTLPPGRPARTGLCVSHIPWRGAGPEGHRA